MGDIKRQIFEVHRQTEDLLNTYADLTVSGGQRTLMLLKIEELSKAGTPLSDADLQIKDGWEQEVRDLEGEIEGFKAALIVLEQSRDAALNEIDNLITMHSIINDYLQIDLTISKEDVQEISAAIKELRAGGEGQ